MSRPNSAKRWEALLYLTYIAKTCGCMSNHGTLMAIVSQISIHGRLELESETIALLEQKVPGLAEEPTQKVLDHLCVYYLKGQIQSDANSVTEIEKTVEQSNQPGIRSNPTQVKPNPIQSNRIIWDKKVFFYLGFGILFVILIIFSFYYFNSDGPINRPLDKPLVKSIVDMEISSAIEEPKQEVPTETTIPTRKTITEDDLSVPASASEKITSQKKIESTRIQIPDQTNITQPGITQPGITQPDKSQPGKSKTNQSQVGKVDETVLIPEKIDTAPPKDADEKPPKLEKTKSLIDHKKRYPGLKLKTKSPKPVKIPKKKTED